MILRRPALTRNLVHFRNASNAAGGSQDPFTFCRNQVQKHDYDSFLLRYFYPRRTHDAYFALKAFNVRGLLLGDVKLSRRVLTFSVA